LTVCKANFDHDALKADPTAWRLLKLVGRQPTTDDDGKPMTLELRNCPCGSTLAKEIV